MWCTAGSHLTSPTSPVGMACQSARSSRITTCHRQIASSLAKSSRAMSYISNTRTAYSPSRLGASHSSPGSGWSVRRVKHNRWWKCRRGRRSSSRHFNTTRPANTSSRPRHPKLVAADCNHPPVPFASPALPETSAHCLPVFGCVPRRSGVRRSVPCHRFLFPRAEKGSPIPA